VKNIFSVVPLNDGEKKGRRSLRQVPFRWVSILYISQINQVYKAASARLISRIPN